MEEEEERVKKKEFSLQFGAVHRTCPFFLKEKNLFNFPNHRFKKENFCIWNVSIQKKILCL